MQGANTTAITSPEVVCNDNQTLYMNVPGWEGNNASYPSQVLLIVIQGKAWVITRSLSLSTIMRMILF